MSEHPYEELQEQEIVRVGCVTRTGKDPTSTLSIDPSDVSAVFSHWFTQKTSEHFGMARKVDSGFCACALCSYSSSGRFQGKVQTSVDV